MVTILEQPCGVGLTSTRFDPIRTRDVARMEGRRTEADISMTPYWVAEFSTPTNKLRHFGELDGFMMAIDEGAFFRAFDTTRPRPIEYLKGPLSGTRAAGGAFDGTATLQAITNSKAIVVSGLPANWQLRVSDYVEIRQSASAVSLHRITADAQADATGVVTLPIRSALDLQNFTTAAIVNFEKPACLMQIDPGSYSASRRRGERQIAFSAQEMFPNEVTP